MNIHPSKIEAMILCGALWDSLWIPVEMQTRIQIQDILKQHGIQWSKVINFLPPTTHKLYREGWYDQEKLVISSDDTYCTRANMLSLSQRWRIDLDDMMKKKIESYQKNSFGYGGSTRGAYEAYMWWKGILESWTSGWGNWIVMQLWPLSTFISEKSIPQDEYQNYLDTFTKTTHTHESVLIGTKIHHIFLDYLLHNNSLNWIKAILQEMLWICKTFETQSNNIPLSIVIEKIMYLLENWSIHDISDEEILKIFWWWEWEITKTSWRVDITLWICYALFLRNPRLWAIIDAVSIWWDTDTYWAIVWNMVWAYTALLPEEKLISRIPEITTIREETQKFIATLQK